MEQRACDLALYVIESRGTVRSAAKKFGISKSTVHKDLSERLPAFNRGLYLQVKQVLEENKAQRHIRGGLATRRKYKGEEKSAKHTEYRTDGHQTYQVQDRRSPVGSRESKEPPAPGIFFRRAGGVLCL